MAFEPMTLEMGFEDGDGSIEVTLEHPLATPFRRAVSTGKYTGSWSYLIARPGPGLPSLLLGSVVWSPGKRFLYFPGRVGEVNSSRFDDEFNGRGLDHVTLELDTEMSRFDEHVAVLGDGKSRGQRRKGRVHSGHMHPWFSILSTNLESYEPIPAELRMRFDAPLSDVQRRCVAMMGTGQRTSLCFPKAEGELPHYYQLDVWAGRGAGWADKYADALPWPTVSGVVDKHRGEEVERVAGRHAFEESAGIVFVLTRPSGTLLKGGLVHAEIEPSNERNIPS